MSDIQISRLIISVMDFAYFYLGILTGVIIQHCGPKICGIVGAILFSTGLIASAFATSTTHLLITFGVLSG